MAFFLFVAEFNNARNGSIVDFCCDSIGDGYVVRWLDGQSIRALEKLGKVIIR